MPSGNQVTVLLAEDHALVRRGLRALLQAAGNLRVVGEARTGREAVEQARTLMPDVIVMDIAMPELNGLEATRQIMAANRAAKVIVLSGHSDYEYPERLSAAGVAGFLEKHTSAEILARAIRAVARGRRFFSPAIAERLRGARDRQRGRPGRAKAKASRLTFRECEVLQLVAEGSANKQIAAELSLSIKTVEKHRQGLMAKLNIHDTAGLTRYAMAAGVIENNARLMPG
jgi:DNA-binding NarL/FixJ family response regulator